MKSILIDCNNLVIRNLFGQDILTYDPDNKKKVIDTDWELWRFRVFDSIYRSLWAVKGDVRELVLAVDGEDYWRKVFYPGYKDKRKSQREKLEFNWDLFFGKYDELMTEIKENTPFKVIKLKFAESDDIIAAIVKHSKDSSHMEYHIISTDKDFLQLSRSNVNLYNPIKQANISHPNPELWLVEQCLRGQAKDGIFNVKTPLDYPIDKRKPPLGEKMAEKIIAGGYKQWLKDNGFEKRFEHNRILIDFDKIPEKIINRILEYYENYETPIPEKLYPWIEKNNWQGYMEEWFKVESKLLPIY